MLRISRRNAVACDERHRPADRPECNLASRPTPLRIDGALTESAWQAADSITTLTQVEPHQGAAPSARTVARCRQLSCARSCSGFGTAPRPRSHRCCPFHTRWRRASPLRLVPPSRCRSRTHAVTSARCSACCCWPAQDSRYVWLPCTRSPTSRTTLRSSRSPAFRNRGAGLFRSRTPASLRPRQLRAVKTI